MVVVLSVHRRLGMAADGRLEKRDIDPQLLRAGVVSVADVVVEAVRAAQDDAAGQAVAVVGDAVLAAPELTAAAAAGLARPEVMLGELSRVGARLGGDLGPGGTPGSAPGGSAGGPGGGSER